MDRLPPLDKSPLWSDVRDRLLNRIITDHTLPAEAIMSLIGAAGYAEDKSRGLTDAELFGRGFEC